MNTGVNDNRKIECQRSKYHGFYPENEFCPLCEDQDEETPAGMTLYWDGHGNWLRKA